MNRTKKAGNVLLAMAAFIVPVSSGMAAEVTYDRHIAPIFEAYCKKCHGRFLPQKKLKLTSLKNVMKGGESGAVVVPGSPEKSLLVVGLKLAKTDPRRMPPVAENKDPSAQQIALIVEWVRQGAK